MLYRGTVLTVILIAGLSTGVSSVLADEQRGATPAAAGGKQAPATYQAVASATFAPAVVAFLTQPLASQLVTLNPSGSPQITIMWFRYEDGALLFTTTTERVKFRNMQHDPRATFAVLYPANTYKWVIVSGTLFIRQRAGYAGGIFPAAQKHAQPGACPSVRS